MGLDTWLLKLHTKVYRRYLYFSCRSVENSHDRVSLKIVKRICFGICTPTANPFNLGDGRPDELLSDSRDSHEINFKHLHYVRQKSNVDDERGCESWIYSRILSCRMKCSTFANPDVNITLLRILRKISVGTLKLIVDVSKLSDIDSRKKSRIEVCKCVFTETGCALTDNLIYELVLMICFMHRSGYMLGNKRDMEYSALQNPWRRRDRFLEILPTHMDPESPSVKKLAISITTTSTLYHSNERYNNCNIDSIYVLTSITKLITLFAMISWCCYFGAHHGKKILIWCTSQWQQRNFRRTSTTIHTPYICSKIDILHITDSISIYLTFL